MSDLKYFLDKARKISWLGVEFILKGGFPKGKWIPFSDLHRQIQETIDKVKKEVEAVKLGLLDPNKAKRGALIQTARDHSKTTSVLGRVLWELGNNPNLLIKIVCASEEQAKKRIAFLRRHIETNKNLHLLFPHLKPQPDSAWSTTQLYVERDLISPDPSVEAAGILGSFTGSHCVVEGTPIITSKGFIPIEEIEVGDFVFNITGKFQRVVAIAKRPYKGKVYYIKSALQNFVKVGLTPDHKILVRYIEDNIPKVEWIEIGKVVKEPKKYMLCFPKARFTGTHKIFSNKELQQQFMKLYSDKDFWRFLGYYLAEGCVTNWMKDGVNKEKIGHGNTYKVRLVFGSHEDFYMKDVISILTKFGITPHVYDRGNTVEIAFCDKLFWKILTTFGHKAHNKTIPTWIISASKVNKQEFLIGYVRGDGCIVEDRIIITTASPHVTSLLSLFLSEFNCLPCINMSKAGYSYIRNTRIRRRESFSIVFSFRTEEKILNDLILGNNRINFNPNRWKSDDLYYYIPIDKIEEKEYDGLVYDLQVKDGSSFCSLFMTLHNCNLVIFDDIVDFRNAFVYPENLKKIEQAVKENWLNILSEDGYFVAIYTAWTKDDITLKMEKQTDLYYVFKRVIDDDLNPIWEAKYNREALIRKREEIGEEAFARQFQGKIVVDRSNLFNKQSIEACKDPNIEFGEYPDNCLFFTGVDLGHRKKNKSPRTVIFTLAVTEDGKRLPVSIVAGNFSPTETGQLIINEFLKYNPEVIKVENNGYQESILDIISLIDPSLSLPVEGCFTGSQKNDIRVGLPSLATEFDRKLWIIPAKNLDQHPPHCVCGLCLWLRELESYPHGLTDTVMASWFALQGVRQVLGTDTAYNVRVIEYNGEDETITIS